jgi:hypothetical protein
MSGISILRNLLLKQAVKESGQASGIMSIGDSVRKLVERRLQSYLVSAANKGIDLDKFSESQIKYMLEMNQPYNRAKMALRKEKGIKSADVLDMKGRKLDKDKPIIGGTQQTLDDEITQAYNKAVKEGKLENVRLKDGRKIESEEDFRNYIDELNEDNNLATGGRAGFKKGLLTVSGVNPTFDMEKKMQEIREAFYALPVRTQKRIGFKKFSEIYAQENFSSGGRAGFFLGSRNPRGLGLLRQILNYMSKKGIKEGRFKGANLSGLDMLRLSNPKAFNKLLEDVRGKVNIKEGIMGTDTVRAQQRALREKRKGITAGALEVAKDMKARDIKIKKKIAEEAENTIIPKVKKTLMEGMGMSEEAAEKAARGMAEAAQNMRLTDDPPIITKEGILELENVLKNLETGGKKKRDLNADGGRAGFKMGRRAFLKLMGGVGAGIGALKSGLLKLAGKEAAPQIAKEVVEQTTKSTPPPYFFELANKIKSLGKQDKVTYADRVEIHRYTGKNGDEYELVEDLSTGDIKITKDKLGMAGSGEETYEGVMDRSVLEYKKGDVNVDPDKKIASKAPDEYDEYKVEFDVDGTEAEADDMSEFIRKEIIEETTSEAPKIKKAAGGVAGMVNKRFDFDSGGSPLQRLRQSIVNDLLKNVPGIPEADLQILVKDINLDMSPEEAQASIKANFLQLYGKAQGGLAGMLGE